MSSIAFVFRVLLPALAFIGVARASAEAPPPPLAVPAIMGPKPTIAVGVIEARGGYGNSNWDVGNGLRSMLSKALEDSNRFVVVERANLDQLLNERQLQASHVAGGTAPGVKMIAAQYLVVGSVAEFGEPNKGGGLNIGGGLLGGLAGLGLNHKTGKVKIDLRIVNARSGEVIESFTVSKSASSTGIGFTGNYEGVAFGGDTFMRTPLGDASRKALEDAVGHIAAALSRGPWEGKVVGVSAAGTVIINAGSEAGVLAGDRLRIERVGAALTDPDTGQILSQQRYTLGEIVIGVVQPKVAGGRFTPAVAGIAPERGDLVVFIAR